MNNIDDFMDKLKNIIKSDTIIGEKIDLSPDISAIPIVKVNFGFGGWNKENDEKKGNQGLGGAGNITPIAFLVMEKGEVKIMKIKEKESLPDMLVKKIPELIKKYSGKESKKQNKKKESKESSCKPDDEDKNE